MRQQTKYTRRRTMTMLKHRYPKLPIHHIQNANIYELSNACDRWARASARHKLVRRRQMSLRCESHSVSSFNVRNIRRREYSNKLNTMDIPRPCGCKGCRTCLTCEKKYDIEQKSFLNDYKVSITKWNEL